MKELGYDLSKHASKGIDDLPGIEFGHVITMGCGDECPLVPAKNRVDWDIPDPKDMPPDEFRRIRDDIGNRVRALLESGD
jgi:arsenate reductase